MRLWAWAFPLFFTGLGVVFAVLAFMRESGEERTTFTIMGITFIGVSVLLMAVYSWMHRAAAAARRLQQTGKQAYAQVTRVEDTGVTVNNSPRVHLTLQVRPADAPAFEIDTKKVVSRVSIPQVGATYSIKYDPADPQNFVFDESPTTGGGVEQMVRAALDSKGVTGERQEEAVRYALEQTAAGETSLDLRRWTRAEEEKDEDPLDRLKKLAELRESGVLTQSEFEVQKAKILAGL